MSEIGHRVLALSELVGPEPRMSDQLHPTFLQVDTSEDPSFPGFHLSIQQLLYVDLHPLWHLSWMH